MSVKRVLPVSKNMFITTSAELAYKHARVVGLYPVGESIIATDAKYSCWYAKYVLKGPFSLGEPIIFKDERMSRWYKEEVLDRDWIGEARVRDSLIAAFNLGNYHR